MSMVALQYNFIYGHWNLNVISFSCVMNCSFDFFQLLKNVKNILSFWAVHRWCQDLGHGCSLLIPILGSNDDHADKKTKRSWFRNWMESAKSTLGHWRWMWIPGMRLNLKETQTEVRGSQIPLEGLSCPTTGMTNTAQDSCCSSSSTEANSREPSLKHPNNCLQNAQEFNEWRPEEEEKVN